MWVRIVIFVIGRSPTDVGNYRPVQFPSSRRVGLPGKGSPLQACPVEALTIYTAPGAQGRDTGQGGEIAHHHGAGREAHHRLSFDLRSSCDKNACPTAHGAYGGSSWGPGDL